MLPSYLIFLLSCLVPRRRDLWLFGAWMGRRYSDNPKYIFRHVREHVPDVEALWIVKDRSLHAELRDAGVPVARALSPRGVWSQLRAGLVVFTHSVPDEYHSPLIAPWALRVQTWHGMPIKKIGYDDNTQQRSRASVLVRSLLFPCDLDRCDLVIAGGEDDAEKYRSAFNVRPADVRITGYPRNDELLRCATPPAAGREPRRAIYMPTLRGAPGSEFELLRTSGFDFGRADEALQSAGWHLSVKLHPVQALSPEDRRSLDRAEHMDALPSEMDLYSRVGTFDALITDFSGVYFDFLITGKPIVMAPFEIERYLERDRELYYEYEDICPDAPCRTWDEVFARLTELRYAEGPPSARYTSLQRRFHRYLDASSSARVVAEIQGLRFPTRTGSAPARQTGS